MGTFSLRSAMNAHRVAAEKLYPLPRRMCSVCIRKVWKTKYLCKYLCKLVCAEQSKTTFHGCREFCARKKLPDKSSYVCNLLDNVDKCVPRQQMAADSHSRAAVDTQLGVLGCLSSVCLPVSLSVSRLSVCPLPCALSWQKWCNASQVKTFLTVANRRHCWHWCFSALEQAGEVKERHPRASTSALYIADFN